MMKFCVILCLSFLALGVPQPLRAQSQGVPQLGFAAGPYELSPISNNTACMDVSGAGTSNGTKVQAYTCNGTSAQEWFLNPITTLYGVGYEIVSQNSGSCLDINQVSNSNGALLHQWQCLGSSQLSQIWQPYPYGSSFELVSLYDGKCLDLPSGSSANGTPLQQWDCQQGNNTNQLWNLSRSSPEGIAQQGLSSGPYTVQPVVNANVCADVNGAGTVAGTRVQAYQCNGTTAQEWNFTPVTTSVGPGYQLVNVNSGQCLDIAGGSGTNGSVTVQWSCLGPLKLSQVWQVFPFGSYNEIVSLSSGKCLDLTNGSDANGTQLQQWNCDEGHNSNQLWSLVAASAFLPAFRGSSTLILATPTLAATGQTVTLTGQAVSSSGTPSGTLSFYEDGALLGSAALNSAGIATFSVPGVTNGSHTMSAGYSGSSLYQASSGAVQVMVTQATVGVQAAQADSFVDSIGVQTHLDYLSTPYFTQWPKVFSELVLSGIRHIRDGNTTSPTLFAEHQQLASAGIRALIGVPMNAAIAPGLLQQYYAGAGDLDSIEAPNECDNGNNCGSGSLDGIVNVAAFMPTLDASGLRFNVPVVGPSFVSPLSYAYSPNLAQMMSFNNLHLYFGGRNPGSSGWGGGDAHGNRYGSLPFWLDQTNENGPGVPVMITETGYISFPTTNTPWTIPESVEANYKPRILLLAFNYGIRRTYLYEFIDELAEPGFGLLRSDMSEKPAFVAIKNLTGLLTDPGSAFQPGKLNYSLTGGDNTITTTLLEKRDGSYWLIVWSEQSSYDPSTNTPTPVAPQNVTLTLAGPAVAQTVYQFDNTGNATASSAMLPSQSITLPISDSISVVKITPP